MLPSCSVEKEIRLKRLALFLATVALAATPALALAAEPFSGNLSVDQEVPAPTLPDGYTGTGTASATISDDEASIDYEVAFEGLTGPLMAAHIHYGEAGVAGGVMFPLAHAEASFSGTLTEADFTPVDSGPQTFADALAAIRAGESYVNLHTEANGSGELRGQLNALPDTAAPSVGSAAGSVGIGLPAIVFAIVGLALFALATRRLLRA